MPLAVHKASISLGFGAFTTLQEDKRGLYVEARLHDNMWVEPIRQAIEGKAITGMSFRFEVMRGGGWQADELMAASMGPTIGPWTRHDLRGAEGQQLGQELQLQHRDGRPLDVLAHGAPLTLGNGAVIGWMGSTLDITERTSAARERERMERKLLEVKQLDTPLDPKDVGRGRRVAAGGDGAALTGLDFRRARDHHRPRSSGGQRHAR
mgnify:CR=1 FL=1